MDRVTIPEYPIPVDLEKVLVNNLQMYNGITNASRTYLKVLQALKDAKSIDVSENHYLLLLKLALYLEDYQCNVDMRKYEMFDKTIVRLKDKTNTFQITAEEIDEERPWIRPNDLVDVINTKDNVVYTLKVKNVQQNDIMANDDIGRLCETHTADKIYNIKFRFQNYPLRCSHYALSMIHQHKTKNFLFPCKRKSYVTRNLSIYDDFTAFSATIAKNPEQKQAVIHIVHKSSFPAPYILYGPPGTGKTATLVEAICQIQANSSRAYVLVCTPSNTAADEIAKRMLEFISPQFVYRIYSQSKDPSTIDVALRDCSNYEEGKVTFVKYEVLVNKRIVITTLCNCMRLITMRLSARHFSHVIIDEAGQSTEPDILIPISLVSENGQLHSQVIVAGDPQQLGPTVISKLAEVVLGRSILERLMSCDTYQKGNNNKYNSKYITKLLINYRSHPSIVHVSNKLFYENELISKFYTNSREENIFPIRFHGIRGKEEKYFHSTSSCNHKEVQVVLDYIDKLIGNKTDLNIGNISPKDIGIVTPFALQSRIIKNKLKNKNLKDVHVGTVELFQGQERKVMIMTTVRSKTFFHDGQKHIGFLSNPKRFNVAVTRAKNILVVVGDPTVLQIDDKWNYLLNYCVKNKSYCGVKFFLNSLNDEQNVRGLEEKIIIKSAKLFESDYEKDLLKSLEAMLYPQDEDIYKLIEKLDLQYQDVHRDYKKPNINSSISPVRANIIFSTPAARSNINPSTTAVRRNIYSSNMAVQPNYYNYYGNSTGSFQTEERKSKWKCTIL